VSKVVHDTCGWLAYFADEPYEVHQWALRGIGEEKANQYAAAPRATPGRGRKEGACP
jgi:hypothetical protein